MIAAISARRLIATLGLLTLASSASAECAWVLWIAQNPPGRGNIPPSAWRAFAGHESKKACEQAMNTLEAQ